MAQQLKVQDHTSLLDMCSKTDKPSKTKTPPKNSNIAQHLTIRFLSQSKRLSRGKGITTTTTKMMNFSSLKLISVGKTVLPVSLLELIRGSQTPELIKSLLAPHMILLSGLK